MSAFYIDLELYTGYQSSKVLLQVALQNQGFMQLMNV
jgi:hypothetical protein